MERFEAFQAVVSGFRAILSDFCSTFCHRRATVLVSLARWRPQLSKDWNLFWKDCLLSNSLSIAPIDAILRGFLSVFLSRKNGIRRVPDRVVVLTFKHFQTPVRHFQTRAIPKRGVQTGKILGCPGLSWVILGFLIPGYPRITQDIAYLKVSDDRKGVQTTKQLFKRLNSRLRCRSNILFEHRLNLKTTALDLQVACDLGLTHVKPWVISLPLYMMLCRLCYCGYCFLAFVVMCLLSIAHWSVCAIGLFVQRVHTVQHLYWITTEVQYNAVPQCTVVLYGRGWLYYV